MMSLSAVLVILAAAASAQVDLSVTPATVGRQVVRVSLPFPAGVLHEGERLVASVGDREISTAVRVLTWHANAGAGKPSARRAFVTFPYEFPDGKPVAFRLKPALPATQSAGQFAVAVTVDGAVIRIAYRDGPALQARLIAPARTSTDAPKIETVESNAQFLWQRIRLPDAKWPRIVELRVDSLGTVMLVAHLQRNTAGDAYAPDLGWEVKSSAAPSRVQLGSRSVSVEQASLSHRFHEGVPGEFLFEGERFRINHPAAAFKKRGQIEVRGDGDRGFVYRYLRCQVGEKVPMQESAWQRAELVITPATLAPLTSVLEYPHEAQVSWASWDRLYATGKPLDLSPQPELSKLVRYHHEAIIHSSAQGDDWGNVTGYSDGVTTGSAFGMNRLNHAPAIFEEAWRSGNRRLRDVAVNWCDNFHDLSIWWGPQGFGGTRYNNVRAMNQTPLDNDNHFMWRSNSAVDFCTKGYATFLLAYEQTGDPRMLEALDAQVNYASRFVRCDRGEARNIGDADDFMRLYRYTGETRYFDQAMRLFRELRTKLSTGDLFSQGGQPIEPNPPFIEDDDMGYRHPFAKPYIIGYALLGLPQLARTAPEEPKLRAVIQAVADFMAESQDPAGGWRYPHPRSTGLLLNQAMEHAWQIVQADRWLGPQDRHLDAIERVLRQRLHGWKHTGRIAAGVTGWEFATGKVKDREAIYQLYKRPADRDFTRDHAEGQMSFGSSPPEGLVYFPGVLAYYLEYRPAERLLAAPGADEPLGKLLARVKGKGR